MSQERLNGLAILCIGKELLENMNFELISNDFASTRARKNVLCDYFLIFKKIIPLFLFVSGHKNEWVRYSFKN